MLSKMCGFMASHYGKKLALSLLCPHGLTFTWWGCCSLCFWHKPTELAHSFLFCSCAYFCLSFNCISFHKFSRLCLTGPLSYTPQWGAADAEIKVPSGENTELKRSPIQAWSRSLNSHTCYAYCQGVLPCLFLPFQSIHLLFVPRSGELRTQKLKFHLVRTQSLNVLPLKPGVSPYIAIHATFTARDFFLAYFYTSGPFTCIFSKTSSDFSLCWLWLTHGSCVGPQNKIGHPAGCRFPYWVPAEYK